MEEDKLTLWLSDLPENRKAALSKLRNIIVDNLPSGFEERIEGGFLHYVVPHSIYPAGYHCNPEQALPFLSVANQKNFIALYHMGIYSDTDLLNWFVNAYSETVKGKLDMGKSCIRFKKIETLPYDLIAELMQKMNVSQWIEKYEDARQSQYKKSI